MKKGFVFYHGWGCDSSFWKKISPFFANYPCEFFDDGYFGISHSPCLSNSVNWVGIGHSLGFAKLLTNHSIKLNSIICIQGFLNFVGYNQRLQNLRKVKLLKMIEQFNISSEKVLYNFCQQMRYDDQQEILNKNHICKHILLRDLSAINSEFFQPAIPTLVLASNDDSIVPPAVVHDNFDNTNAKVIFYNDAGHALGNKFPELVFNEIMDFVNAQ